MSTTDDTSHQGRRGTTPPRKRTVVAEGRQALRPHRPDRRAHRGRGRRVRRRVAVTTTRRPPTPRPAPANELIESGPMTWQKAELTGEDVDFGPNCDTETGRIMLPTVYAPPCVEPFTGDNGGDTYPGVTADEVKIVHYLADPALDPLIAATVEGAGAEVNVESAPGDRRQLRRALQQDLRDATGAPSWSRPTSAPGPAPTWRRPGRTPSPSPRSSRSPSSAARPRPAPCSRARSRRARSSAAPAARRPCPRRSWSEYEPYLWQVGPTPDQATALAAEAIGNLAGPGKAELAGDDATKAKDRVYGLLHYDTPDGDHEAVFEQFTAALDGQRHRAGHRRRVHARPGAGPDERPHEHRQADGRGRHHDHLLRRPADAGVAHRRGDGPELPPGVDPRPQRARWTPPSSPARPT